ncbi:MAG: hypothetical protein U5L75_01790 [Candidatus Campbellbacteria bacterium]|nr:hypothetical protein [Candidatus Campbellbacteria bacterium]
MSNNLEKKENGNSLAPFPSVSTREELIDQVNNALEWQENNNGRVRGISLKTDSLGAIKTMSGKDSQEKIQKLLNEIDVDFDLSKIQSYSWYPAAYGPVIYLVAAHLFSWGPKDLEELGRLSTRGSMLIKVIMRFVSMKVTLRRGSQVWHKYYDFGDLVPVEYSDEGSYIIFKIEEYNVHPINEYYHKGYFGGIVELVTGSDNVVVEVRRSIYQGEESSEYKISW